MHSITHFLVSLDLLLLLDIPFGKAALFSLFFAVLIDADLLIGKIFGKPKHHSRTWFQEPLALLFVALPIAALLSRFITDAYIVVLIPYASHILLDYLTVHEVSPFAPFSKKNVNVGFVKPIGKKKGLLSEWWVLGIAVIGLLFALT